jgi:hypothetical protein
MSISPQLPIPNEGSNKPSQPDIKVYQPYFGIPKGPTLKSFLIRKLPSASASIYLHTNNLTEITRAYTNAAGHLFVEGESLAGTKPPVNVVTNPTTLNDTLNILNNLHQKTFYDQFEGGYKILAVYQQPKERGEIMRADAKIEKAWKDSQALKMKIRLLDGKEKEVRFASHLENVLIE